MPKSITGSVGRGGRNFPASDVMTIQYLLNCVPASQGGPARELAVDGAAGPKTIAAIEGYQRKLGGFADGRVDPGGATLRALQARDPNPNQALSPNAAKSAFPGNAAKGSAGKDVFGNKTLQSPGKSGFDQFGNKAAGAKGPGMAMPGGGKDIGGPPGAKGAFGKGLW